MLCFLHSLHHIVIKPGESSSFFKDYKLRKMKMKLSFEAEASQLHLSHMFQIAIFKTLLQKQRIAAAELQRSLRLDNQAFHSVFYRSVDAGTNSLREPS